MTRTAGVVADDELDQLLSGASAVPGQPLGPSPGARDLARAVGVAWVELIADLAGQAILGRTVRHPDKLAGVVTDVARLARELDDRELVALDEQLPQLVAATFDAPDAEGRKQAGLALRDWVATYADIIGGDGGRRLRRKVVLRRGVHPLATHLRGIKGIGERRLERLYDARLLTRDALAAAQPEELAAVARIPLALAREVVEASRRFVAQQRATTLRNFRVLAADVVTSVSEGGAAKAGRARLIAALRTALEGIEGLMEEIEGHKGGSR